MKIGRNDPCPCGSGKKYKKCCGNTANKSSESSRFKRGHIAAQTQDPQDPFSSRGPKVELSMKLLCKIEYNALLNLLGVDLKTLKRWKNRLLEAQQREIFLQIKEMNAIDPHVRSQSSGKLALLFNDTQLSWEERDELRTRHLENQCIISFDGSETGKFFSSPHADAREKDGEDFLIFLLYHLLHHDEVGQFKSNNLVRIKSPQLLFLGKIFRSLYKGTSEIELSHISVEVKDELFDALSKTVKDKKRRVALKTRPDLLDYSILDYLNESDPLIDAEDFDYNFTRFYFDSQKNSISQQDPYGDKRTINLTKDPEELTNFGELEKEIFQKIYSVLLFHFSDGVTLTYADLLFHHYYFLVPASLRNVGEIVSKITGESWGENRVKFDSFTTLIRGTDVNQALRNLLWNYYDYDYDHELYSFLLNLSRRRITLLQRVFNCLWDQFSLVNNKKDTTTHSYQLVLRRRERGEVSLYDGVIVEGLLDIYPSAYELMIKSNTIELNLGEKVLSLLSSNDYQKLTETFFLSNKGELIRSCYEKEVQKIRRGILTRGNLEVSGFSLDADLRDSSPMGFFLKSKKFWNISHDISMVIADFQNFIKMQHGLSSVKYEISPEYHIPSEEMEIGVDLYSDRPDLFNVSFRSKTKKVQFHYAALPDLSRMISLFEQGIGAISNYENRDLAVQKRGLQRKNDLLFLRHSGIFLMSMIYLFKMRDHDENRVLKNKNEEKKKRKILKSLVAHHVNSVMEKKKEYTPHLDVVNKGCDDLDCDFQDHLSIKMNRIFQDLFQFLDQSLWPKEADNQEVLLANNELYSFEKKHLQRKFTRFIMDLMTPKEPIKAGRFFQKASSSIQVNFDKEESLCNSLNYLNYKDAFFKILQIFNQQSFLKESQRVIHYVKIDGVEACELDAQDLVSQMHLTDQSHELGDGESQINWFGLHPKLFFQGRELTDQEAKQFVNQPYVYYEGKLYIVNKESIPTMKWLDYFWDQLEEGMRQRAERLLHLKENSKSKESEIYPQARSQSLDIIALKQSGLEVVGPSRWQEISRNFDKLIQEGNQDFLDPQMFPLTTQLPLKEYQREGVNWLIQLRELGMGGILADDMGLGKTLQALAMLSYYKEKKMLGATLIIVPTSLVYNWKSEIEKFTPYLDHDIFESSKKEHFKKLWEKREGTLTIMSYGLMERNKKFLEDCHFDIVLFDEAQNLKNIRAKRTTVARQIQAQTKICLTGTPMENHYGEFYSLIDLVLPGALGDYTDFMSKFGPKKVCGSRDIEYLKNKTLPIVKRRLKQLVLKDLPEKQESTILLDFEKNQRKIYRDIAISWNDTIKEYIEEYGEASGQGQLKMLTALLRLRQICSFPQILDGVEYDNTSPKEEILLSSLEELYEKGESALVFTNFVTTQKHLLAKMKERGIFALGISGATPSKRRMEILEEFNKEGQACMLMMTLKTGGVGLNLTKASYVFHLEPWWNPATEHQATDRVHRLGQKRSVQVYRYLMKGSLEEKIQELKERKSKAFDSLLNTQVQVESSELDLRQTKQTHYGKNSLSSEDFFYLIS